MKPLLLIALLALLTVSAMAADVSLAWDPSPSPNVTGYRVYWGETSGTYPNMLDVGNQTTKTISGLQQGKTYYFAVSAYNSSGESGYSNEVSKAFPLPKPEPPSNLRIIVLEIGTDGTVNMRLVDPVDFFRPIRG